MEKEKKWTKKEWLQQINNLQRTCEELDRQNKILRERNLTLVIMLNESIGDISKVLAKLTSKINT